MEGEGHMERVDLAAGKRNLEEEMMMRNGFEEWPLLRAVKQFTGRVQQSRLARQCGGTGSRACSAMASTLARAEGSTPNNPYAMYAPGRYIRGC